MEYRSLRVRVIGPLEPFAEGFRGELGERGYKAWSAKHQLHLVTHLSAVGGDADAREAGARGGIPRLQAEAVLGVAVVVDTTRIQVADTDRQALAHVIGDDRLGDLPMTKLSRRSILGPIEPSQMEIGCAGAGPVSSSSRE